MKSRLLYHLKKYKNLIDIEYNDRILIEMVNDLKTTLIKNSKDKELNYIEDVWVLKRNNLKELGFTYDEIKEIVISLQLIGLDLNKKKY